MASDQETVAHAPEEDFSHYKLRRARAQPGGTGYSFACPECKRSNSIADSAAAKGMGQFIYSGPFSFIWAADLWVLVAAAAAISLTNLRRAPNYPTMPTIVLTFALAFAFLWFIR